MNMMNVIPGLLTKNTMPFGERALDALVMIIKGMLMVFLVLAVLMVILMIMEKAFAKKTKAKKTEVSSPAAVEPVAEEAPDEDDGAIVAAITAALAVMMEAEGTTGGFRVVSFKRTGKKAAWNNK